MIKHTRNIEQIRDCYGCGVCSIACKDRLIKLRLNSKGFYEPFIEDKKKCTHCGLCLKVCSFSHRDLALQNSSPIGSYAGWSINNIYRSTCSSGGVAYAFAETLLNEGFKVCTVKYNGIEGRAEHYIAHNSRELSASVGSKYIQSYTYKGFQSINPNEKNLVIGTPCQIDSFRRYIQLFHKEHNFILIDFFCHGVPSLRLWHKYLLEVRKQGIDPIFVSWRNKSKGWEDSFQIAIDNTEFMGDISQLNEKIRHCYYRACRSDNDPFYYLFLSNVCLNKACYKNCKFKYKKSSADIRIGDLWGDLFKGNEDGVSAIVSFTQKGQDVIEQSQCKLFPYKFEEIAQGQMKVAPKQTFVYNLCLLMLRIPSLRIYTLHKIVHIIQLISLNVRKLLRL